MIFAKEPFRSMEAELQILARDHWQEVAAHKDTIPLVLDIERYHAIEDSGGLHVLTARHDGQLVGYIIHVVAPSLHYSVLAAQDDAHYLKPEFRRGWTGVKMIRAAEAMLRDLGVKAVSYHHKTRPDIDKGAVFERLGYEPVERIYMKVL